MDNHNDTIVAHRATGIYSNKAMSIEIKPSNAIFLFILCTLPLIITIALERKNPTPEPIPTGVITRCEIISDKAVRIIR